MDKKINEFIGFFLYDCMEMGILNQTGKDLILNSKDLSDLPNNGYDKLQLAVTQLLDETADEIVESLMSSFQDDQVVYKTMSGNVTKKDLLSNKEERRDYLYAVFNLAKILLKKEADKQELKH